jgi:branched-chain amino acid aminotransferase
MNTALSAQATAAAPAAAPDYIYYINGAFAPASQAQVAVDDLGLVRGYGVFDVLRTYGRRPFHLGRHLERLERSAAQIDLALPMPIAAIEQVVLETLARNDAVGLAENVTVRVLVTGGSSSSFLLPEGRPSLLVMIAAVKPQPAQRYAEGATLITTDLPRFLPTVKSTNYITAIMAQQRAHQAGAVEALYRTADGHVTECTTSNFFILRGEQLITPAAEVLPGITRGVVLEIAADLYDVVLRPVSLAEVATADEAFITSTTKEVMPIVRVDDAALGAIMIGNGRPGPHTHRLHQLFQTTAIQTTPT